MRLTAGLDSGGQPTAFSVRLVSPTILLPVFPAVEPVLKEKHIDPSALDVLPTEEGLRAFVTSTDQNAVFSFADEPPEARHPGEASEGSTSLYRRRDTDAPSGASRV